MRRCCSTSTTTAWFIFVSSCCCRRYHHASSVQALDLFGLVGGGGRSGRKPTVLQLELLQRASRVRAKFGPKSPLDYCAQDDSELSAMLYFDSSFSTATKDKNKGSGRRGFCNWLLPNRIMVGQYPGQTPEKGGPTSDEVHDHLQKMVENANIRLFGSLQTEIPSQMDYEAWNAKGGMIFLEPEYIRQRFPHPFTHYAPLVQQISSSGGMEESIRFLHCPIEDLNVPESQQPLQEFLLELLDFLLLAEDDCSAMYLHCWGGRGRAGLVSGCLLSLIYPHLTAPQILQWIQTGYASRLGHDNMPTQLARSPQTDTQRLFVTNFVQEYQGYLSSASSR